MIPFLRYFIIAMGQSQTFLLLQRSMFFGDLAKIGVKKDKKQLKSFLISDTILMFDRRAVFFSTGKACGHRA